MSSVATDKPDVLPRFTATEKWVHRTTGMLVAVLTVTGAVLYYEPFALAVGRRPLVEGVHIGAGLGLPLPTLVGVFASPALRRDFAVLGRMTHLDWQWLRRRDRRTARLPIGKFNGGQKLATALFAGLLLAQLATGALMHWNQPFPDDWRTGATFAHDWFALRADLYALGHIAFALRDGNALESMINGEVPARWARKKAPLWYEELRTPPS